MKIQKILYVVASLLLFTVNSIADDITLDFEGLKDYEQVQDFYNGGAGSEGSTKGLDYNITFSANTLALIDSDAGGGGNFANEPSPDTTFFFTGSDTNIYMNVEGGFTEGFSFYYTSIQYEGDVEVWTEPNGQGKKIGTLHLEVTPSLGKGDPYGTYDNWVKKSLSFDGRAKSIVFKGVANQIAFDNITLNPSSPVSLGLSNAFSPESFSSSKGFSPILHNFDSNYANELKISLKVTGDDRELDSLCTKIKFTLMDADGHGARLKDNGCKVTDHEWEGFKWNNNLVQLEFKVNKVEEDGGFYFKNAILQACLNSDSTKCVDIMKGITVYATDFNIKEDAFNFSNSIGWNNPKVRTKDSIPYKGINTFGKYAMVIDSYLSGSKIDKSGETGKESFWSSIGYKKFEDLDKDGYIAVLNSYEWGHGLCYGMASVSSAYFNNKLSQSWIESATLKEWESSVETHWKNNMEESPFKPLKNKPYTYDGDNIEALSAIIYYFVYQEYYDFARIGNTWVGQSDAKFSIDGTELKNNKTTVLSFGYTKNNKKVGHAVTYVGYIKWKDIEILSLYNNNHPDDFSYMVAKKGKVLPYMFYEDKTISGYSKINYLYVASDKNKLHVSHKQNRAIEKEKIIKYSTLGYMKVSLTGGYFIRIIDIQTNKEINFYPFSNNLEKNKAYINRDSLFYSYVLLPANKKYKVEMKKEKNFPFFKIFVKVPKSDQTLRISNFDNIQKDENESMVVSLVVGENDSDLNMKDESGNEIAVTNEETLEMAPQSVSNVKSLVKTNVKLSWSNPATTSYKETVVIKKESSEPNNITDGIEIYRGNDESFVDTSLDSTMDKVVYYALYTIDTKDNSSEMKIIKVNPYFYTLYGTILDTSDEPIIGVEVKLFDKTKANILGTDSSDKEGLFAFNGLLDGEYVLNFSHPSYTFEKSELNVTVEKKSKEVLMKAEGVANLFMNIPQAVKVGENQTIIWDGVHIDDNAKVNIKLFRDEKWETIASSVPYNQHSYQWNVTASKGEAKIRVALDAITFVEKDVFIFGADELKYDFDGDGDIDIDDIMKVANAWLSKTGNSKFKSEYDYNGDGVIDIKDIMKIASQWGK